MQSTHRSCSIDGCKSAPIKRGWCSMHYQRWRVHGDVMYTPTRTPIIDSPDGSRTCGSCGESQPIENFWRNTKERTGRIGVCKTCMSAKHRAWRADTQEQRREVDKANYRRNRSARIARTTEVAHVRRARESGVPYERGITVDALRLIHGDMCGYCGVEMVFEPSIGRARVAQRATIEHRIPMSRGGSHSIENTMLCCLECNNKKFNRTVEEWEMGSAA